VLADRLSLEERRKRYVTLALAASILLTATLEGFGWIWAERGRTARAGAVDAALAEALSAAKRAEGLLAGSDEPALSRRVEEMNAQIDADRRRAEAIRKLVADLETVRANLAEHSEVQHLGEGGARQTERLVKVHRDTVMRCGRLAGRHASECSGRARAASAIERGRPGPGAVTYGNRPRGGRPGVAGQCACGRPR
jgi:hypothetical protein